MHGRGSTTEDNTAPSPLFTPPKWTFCIATIANDKPCRPQDGPAGGATPWSSRLLPIIGVVFGSLTIPPVLELMQNSFGFRVQAGRWPGRAGGPAGLILRREGVPAAASTGSPYRRGDRRRRHH